MKSLEYLKNNLRYSVVERNKSEQRLRETILDQIAYSCTDGRRNGDRYSYGASASELLPHRDITKVLMSSAAIPLDCFPIGAPQTVNLTSDMLRTPKGREAARQMAETYFREGGTHIQIEVACPEVLRDVQLHPERYGDLLIRISGHTEPFVRLNKVMQDALITRAELR